MNWQFSSTAPFRSHTAAELLLGSATGFSGGGGGARGEWLARSALEGVVDRRSQIHQHAQGLSRRVFGVEHHFPGLADHAQTRDRFVGGELGAAAVHGRKGAERWNV